MADSDDIPEALRDRPLGKISSQQSQVPLWARALGIFILVLAIAIFWLRPKAKEGEPIAAPPATPSPSVEPSSSPSPSPSPSAEPIENVLGHLPYAEAPSSELQGVTSDGQIRLRKMAAERFLAMQAEARASGIRLVPLSGFRTVAQQEYLFFRVKEQRNQQTQKRAEVSAPPGYSEHHTGYAIDIGDAQAPQTNLSASFETTPAFRWLQNNASRYSFELSFPPDNPQGISYEPWHWRYVGDRHSLETFYKARQIKN